MTSLELYTTAIQGLERADTATLQAPAAHAFESRARRVLNVAVAVVGLVLAAPLLIVIALLVKLT